MPYMVTLCNITINIPQILASIYHTYMDPSWEMAGMKWIIFPIESHDENSHVWTHLLNPVEFAKKETSSNRKNMTTNYSDSQEPMGIHPSNLNGIVFRSTLYGGRQSWNDHRPKGTKIASHQRMTLWILSMRLCSIQSDSSWISYCPTWCTIK